MKGHLREHPLAELIRDIIAARLSGALRLARERMKAVIYVEAGEVIFARSNLRVHRLAVCLQRWGAVAEDKLASLLTELMSDQEAGEALVAAGALRTDALTKLYTRQVTDVLRPFLLWTEGEWNFEPRARLIEDVRCHIEMSPLLLEGARQLPAEFAAARLSDEQEIISPVKELPAQLQLHSVEGFILSRVEAPLSLGELLAISGLPDTQTRHSIYALALGGFLTRSHWPAALSANIPGQAHAVNAPDAPPTTIPAGTEKVEVAASAPESKNDAPPDPRVEIEALFAHVNDADYFQILGVTRDADPAEVKRSYYALAKRFHPDRFQRGADASLRARIETAFTQITQAYETLREPRARTAYESKLNAQLGSPASSKAAAHQAASFSKSFAAANRSREQRAEECFQQGLAALKQNNYPSALALLGEATQLAPQQPRYHASYGNVLARDKRTRRQAEAELRMAINLDNRDPSFHVMLAELYHTIGQTQRAAGELERALSLDPNHAPAQRVLNQLRKA
ncbi:MAG: DUF4388 domain-containing protein [Pyrinomonadaceae bacterium]